MLLTEAALIMKTGDDPSVFACPSCFFILSAEDAKHIIDGELHDELNTVECDACGDVFTADTMEVNVAPDSRELLDVEHAKGVEWFHISDSANWLDEVTGDDDFTPYIHAGTLQSALDRYEAHKGKTAYLYKFKLADMTAIDSTVYDDRNAWPEEVGFPCTLTDEKTGEAVDCLRYLNRWEDPGSLSILLDPRHIVDVSMMEYAGEAQEIAA
jgi:hypothetical protein